MNNHASLKMGWPRCYTKSFTAQDVYALGPGKVHKSPAVLNVYSVQLAEPMLESDLHVSQ